MIIKQEYWKIYDYQTRYWQIYDYQTRVPVDV